MFGEIVAMPKTTLFIGSSSAAKSQAKAIVKKFTSPTVEFITWWDAFTPGRTLLEELDAIRDKVHGALLVFSPESETKVRKQKKMTPNLNVLFEFGYFYGHFGKKGVAMIKYGDIFLPSDFGGYIWITGSKFFKRGAVTRVGKRTETDFSKWIQQL
jgi:predicted nucleotide-binding protein